MNLTNLDLDTLRTLVIANDLGGYGQAGARLRRTPSAISLQMKRLQADVGASLFSKSGRGLVLTETGGLVLAYARRMLALNDELLDAVRGPSLKDTVRLGCCQDFADTILPEVLSRFIEHYPHVQIMVRIEGNGTLMEAIDKGVVDLALVIGFDQRATARPLGHIDLVWIAKDGFHPRPDQPLPMVLLGTQCAFRKAAIDALDRSERLWRLAATSPSLNGLWACAGGGLGVTLRSALNLPVGLISSKTLLGLPEPGSFAVSLHVTNAVAASAAAQRVEALISAAVAKILPQASRPRRPLQKHS